MLDRRLLLASGLALAGCTAAPRLRTGPPADLLDAAIAAAGGARALSRVRALDWTGFATVATPDGRALDLRVLTRIEPFRRARTDSWLMTANGADRRALIVERDGAWTERAGERTPLPAAQAAHERAQFALYGLLLLAPLRRAAVTPLPGRDGLRWLRAAHRRAPATDLGFDAQARLVAAENRVPAPDGAGEEAQRFAFGEHAPAGGIVWPRHLAITRAGDPAPWFTLRLATFQPEFG